jgi:hypothetical protein
LAKFLRKFFYVLRYFDMRQKVTVKFYNFKKSSLFTVYDKKLIK